MWDGFELPGAIRHELRGFGQTPLPPAGEFSHVDDLEAALGGEPAALVGASFGAFVCLQVAAERPELVTELVLLDAPLSDHDWSDEIVRLQHEEDGLLEQGDLRGAAILNADFWLTGPEPRERVIEMQERAFELQAESEAEERRPRDHRPERDHGPHAGRRRRARQARLPRDRRAARARDPGAREHAVIDGRRPPARAGATEGDGAACARVPRMTGPNCCGNCHARRI